MALGSARWRTFHKRPSAVRTAVLRPKKNLTAPASAPSAVNLTHPTRHAVAAKRVAEV
jgi:hypothetical protein